MCSAADRYARCARRTGAGRPRDTRLRGGDGTAHGIPVVPDPDDALRPPQRAAVIRAAVEMVMGWRARWSAQAGTRSSAWTADAVTRGQFRGGLPDHRRQFRCVISDDPAADHVTMGSVQLDDVTAEEASRQRGDAGRQQRAALPDHRPHGTGIQDQRPADSAA